MIKTTNAPGPAGAHSSHALTIARNRLMALGEEFSEDDVTQLATDVIDEWELQKSHETAELGSPHDTPFIVNADLCNNGEGQFHGFIG